MLRISSAAVVPLQPLDGALYPSDELSLDAMLAFGHPVCCRCFRCGVIMGVVAGIRKITASALHIRRPRKMGHFPPICLATVAICNDVRQRHKILILLYSNRR